MFKGAITALVTPFKDGKLDEESYRKFIEWQIEEGIDGLLPCGTTGESATLSHEEHKDVIRICIEQAKGRVPVLAGTGSNNTKEAIELTKFAKDMGADAVLLITPYYNKPTQEGLLAHYKAIAKEVSIPMVVYNVPGRTGVNILPSTLQKLKKEIPEVIGIKEATGNLKQVSEIVKACGEDFCVLSGDDFTTLPLLSVGGRGVVSVVSNILPKKTSDMCNLYLNRDTEKAKEIHYDLFPIAKAMFLETNPIPVKTALALMGKMELEFRLPLINMKPENEDKLKKILKTHGLI